MADENKDQEVRFQPLSQGLGFHPFSDGLPYAPISKTSVPQQASRPRMGAGAVSAGPPVFVRPPAAPALRVQVPQPSLVPAPPKEVVLGKFYVVARVAAFALDLSVLSALAIAITSQVLRLQNIQWDVVSNPSVTFVLTLFVLLTDWVLLTFQEVAFKTSLGKRVVGLKLSGSAGSRFVRAFFFLPSIGFFGLGILWCLFDRRKRGWHDWIADLQPIPRVGKG